MIGIYMISNTETGDIYVGSSANIKKRWSGHRCLLRRNKHNNQRMQRSWNKYGESAFTFDVLLDITDSFCNVDQLIAWENTWISVMKPQLNLAPAAGSNLGYRHSAEFRKKISERMKGRKPNAEQRAAASERAKNQDLSYLHTSDVRQKMAVTMRKRNIGGTALLANVMCKRLSQGTTSKQRVIVSVGDEQFVLYGKMHACRLLRTDFNTLSNNSSLYINDEILCALRREHQDYNI